MNRWFISMASVIALSGCFTDGGNGENGIVRFSQMFDFVETSGFDAPVAANRTVLIRLEHADALALGSQKQRGYAELTLEAKPLEGGEAELFPMGFGQFGVVLKKPGAYRLIAKEAGKEVDSIVARAEELNRLRVHQQASVTTTVKTAKGPCIQVEHSALEGLKLYRNQSIQVSVVPLRDDRPLVGFLALTAQAPEHVQFEVPLLLEGTTSPNRLTISPAPNRALGAPAEIIIQEAAGPELTVEIPTVDEDASASCSSS